MEQNPLLPRYYKITCIQHYRINRNQPSFQRFLPAQCIEIQDLLAAIESFDGNYSRRIQELVEEIRIWIRSWQGRPATREMQRAMEVFSEIFFLGQFMGVESRWDEEGVSKRSRYGAATYPGGGDLPTLVTLDPGDHSRARGVQDYESAIIGIFLHELCHVFLGTYACKGDDCGNQGCRKYRRGQRIQHWPAWFIIASHVETVARRLFPEVDIRLGVFGSIVKDGTMPTPACWQLLVDRFPAQEVLGFLDGMTVIQERQISKAYVDSFFGYRGLRVGVERMLWTRDMCLPGAQTVQLMVQMDAEALSAIRARNTQLGNNRHAGHARELDELSPHTPKEAPEEDAHGRG